jgi:hypothetical protein
MPIAGYEEDSAEIQNILISLNLWEITENSRPPPFQFVFESRSILSINDTNTFDDFDPGWDSYCSPDPFYEERCVEV